MHSVRRSVIPALLLLCAACRFQGAAAGSGRDVGHRMSGEQVEFQRCDSLTIGRDSWQHRLAPVGVYDVNALLLKELPHLDGVLALDAFRGEVVTIDLAENRITVHASAGAANAIAQDGVPVRIGTGETGRMLTAYAPVAARRDTLWFLLDSGDLRGTLIDQRVRRDSLLVQHDDSTVDLVVGSRAAIRSGAQFTDLIIDGVLGADYLRRGPVTLDLRRY